MDAVSGARYVGRTLLSAGVEVDLDVEVLIDWMLISLGFRSGGQECPPHIETS